MIDVRDGRCGGYQTVGNAVAAAGGTSDAETGLAQWIGSVVTTQLLAKEFRGGRSHGPVRRKPGAGASTPGRSPLDTSAVAPDPTTPAKSPPAAVDWVLARIGAYVALTKPRIIELLLITTIPAMFAAQRQVPPLTLVLATLVGGTLAAGSANALNCVVDADIDAVMRRTRSRPLARHAVSTEGRADLRHRARRAGRGRALR